jgi:hypothetical protein
MLVCVVFAPSSESAAPDLLWAQTAMGDDEDAITSVVVDSSGNCYVGGFFRGSTVNFGTTNLMNRGSTDAFLNKYGASGGLLWSRQYGGPGYEQIARVAFDREGKILMTGRFSETVSFGTTNLTADGTDIFLAKLSIDGDCIWAVKAGGEFEDFAESVCVDGEGNSYIAGYIRSTNAVFGPFTLTVRPTNPSNPQPDPFIAKYSNSGEVLWVQQISSPGYGYGINVAANPISGVYVTGSFYGVGTFGPTNLTARAKLFLASFGPDGTLRWVNEAGHDTAGDGTYGTDVVTDTKGDIYLTGFFSGPAARFGGLSVTNSGDGQPSDLFLAKYDEHGSVHWVKSAGGTYNEYATRVALDTTGDLYVVGGFESSVANFGGIFVANTFTNFFGWGTGDGFLAKYTSNGDIISVQRFGGSEHDYLVTTAIDGVGNLFVGGAYSSTDMNHGLPPSDWGYEGFIAKFETAVPPRLEARSPGQSIIELSWPALAERFYVETAASFQSPLNWQSNAVPVERVGMTNRVLIDAAAQGGLYRLKRPSP